MNFQSIEIRFPRFVKRFQAANIDGFIIVFLIFGLGAILPSLPIAGPLKGIFFVLVVLAVEPGMVSLTGGTIGHHLRGLRIQNNATGANLNPFFALIRFIVKYPLGVITFITMLTTKRHRAIHDLLSNSVVVLKNPEGEDGLKGLSEQEVLSSRHIYPAWYRRLVIILVYLFFAYPVIGMLLLFLTNMAVSENCFVASDCTQMENLFINLTGFVLLFALAAIVFFGWTGRLWGARRMLRQEDAATTFDP